MKILTQWSVSYFLNARIFLCEIHCLSFTICKMLLLVIFCERQRGGKI